MFGPIIVPPLFKKPYSYVPVPTKAMITVSRTYFILCRAIFPLSNYYIPSDISDLGEELPFTTLTIREKIVEKATLGAQLGIELSEDRCKAHLNDMESFIITELKNSPAYSYFIFDARQKYIERYDLETFDNQVRDPQVEFNIDYLKTVYNEQLVEDIKYMKVYDS